MFFLLILTLMNGDSVSIKTLAQTYLTAYQAQDLEALAGFYAEDAHLWVPTSQIDIQGRALISQAQQEWFSYGTIRFEVEGCYVSGRMAVFQGVTHFKANPEKFLPLLPQLNFHGSFVTILEIVDDKVIKHTDYLDRETFRQQMKELGVAFAPLATP